MGRFAASTARGVQGSRCSGMTCKPVSRGANDGAADRTSSGYGVFPDGVGNTPNFIIMAGLPFAAACWRPLFLRRTTMLTVTDMAESRVLVVWYVRTN